MPPVACVSAIFPGCWDDLVVSGRKGSMQAPEEGSAHGMLLRVREPRLLQDLSQRLNHILGGRNMSWSGEIVKNKTRLDLNKRILKRLQVSSTWISLSLSL